MPPESADSVESAYRALVAAMTPLERIARASAMTSWANAMVARQLLAERGPMSSERLRWEVARRRYASDPTTLRMIDRHLETMGRDADT